MLTKEECEKALENLRVLERKDNFTKWGGQVAPQINCDVIEQLIKERFEPQPYKFEELKKGMWVWMAWFKEGAEKGEFAKILNTYTTPPYYYNDEDGEEHERVEFRIGDGSGTIDFDAWKFYPPTKAMEY